MNSKKSITLAHYVLLKIGPIDIDKLQIILYFIEAIHLARFNKGIIDEKFEAWKNGPILKSIYNIFNGKSISKSIDITNLPKKDKINLSKDQENLINIVINHYSIKSNNDLVYESQDTIWKDTREGLNPNENSNKKMNKKEIRLYYRKILINSENENLKKIGKAFKWSIINNLIKRFNKTWIELAK